MIEAHGLTKQFGSVTAVDDLSFTVRPGVVTGFLGPNGAGKTTTMRMILGLDRPSAGAVTVAGRRYTELPAPLHVVGALLDARAVHGQRRVYDHLLGLAHSNGIGKKRVGEVLSLVGLDGVARKRSRTFSLGMSQRLGLAAALLGDPPVLMFDEPVNGLDPEGILWIRNLMRGLAAEGRTVLVSSHLLSEMALTADHLVVIGRGRLIADVSTEEFINGDTPQTVRVRMTDSSEGSSFVSHLMAAGGEVSINAEHLLTVTGLSSDQIGALAARDGVVLAELTPRQSSLEQVFMEKTDLYLEYHAERASR